MEMGPVDNENRVNQKLSGRDTVPADSVNKSDAAETGVREQIAQTADEHRLRSQRREDLDQWLPQTTDDEKYLTENLARQLAESRANKADAINGDSEVSEASKARIEMARRRAESGFYDKPEVMKIIAEKLSDQFKGEKIDRENDDT